MREIVRPVTAALSVACLAIAMTAASNSGAFAQAKQQQMAPAAKQPAPAAQAAAPAQDQAAPIKQIALTDKQIDGAIAAAKEMDPITAKLSQDAKPDPKIVAQLEGIAKKNGFASYDEYNSVVDNISLVLGGFDPQTKKYVGPEAVVKAQIAQVQADKKMSAKDKKDALADLNEALKSPPPAVENKGNIDLVTKSYDKLMEEFGGSDDN
ncbi:MULTISPECIES: hypothetical protein [unclassified Bradyrhizobium]|uniref:hypothetical protein n=1 Tax=unclassified Bradyrhizobium TaxID=2631580 RepID=UPI001BA45425|nr:MULTISPECIES: hypothetical protein [unclassified Bradyrhizobium]MBR1207499.1 hypothetical protein [Bradyrhizobium sp. AUGA SZCCT0124]MBR1315915.1 hypothetical protein [Bradyrhizobium sp. AUGA SZCCT0051]MBR1344021.1 hypothetical protein [Bradyrhizobium sp. AUGA SZCCT0105]MBR1357992.1 hypothetical protein [Bradyrhizobium sp. AUGA SZCCT0045]